MNVSFLPFEKAFFLIKTTHAELNLWLEKTQITRGFSFAASQFNFQRIYGGDDKEHLMV